MLTTDERNAAALAVMGAADRAPTPTPAVETPAPEPEKTPEAPKDTIAAVVQSGQPDSLAALIRDRREAKAAKEAKETEAQSLATRLAEAEAKLARMTKADIVADPVGWAEERELTPEERAIVGEAMLYSLVPDKADANVRVRLLEAKQAREKKLAERERETAQTKAEQERAMSTFHEYVRAVSDAAKQVAPGTFADSEAWFGGDHETYAQSLIATANNMAEAAKQRGEVADLSFTAVAKTLEADISARFARRKPTTPSTGTSQPQGQTAPSAKQGAGQTISTQGLTGGGAPRPPAKTDEERVRRAAEVVFRTK